MYHPAALERAADSIIGVCTQGLGRSREGRLPILERVWVFLGLLPIHTSISGSRLLKSSCRSGCSKEEERTRERRLSTWYMTNHCRLMELKCSHFIDFST